MGYGVLMFYLRLVCAINVTDVLNNYKLYYHTILFFLFGRYFYVNILALKFNKDAKYSAIPTSFLNFSFIIFLTALMIDFGEKLNGNNYLFYFL
tara:strand:- start:258 stop:539 length:282 start_codon:yes stop_codon:yes gene_type:complete